VVCDLQEIRASDRAGEGRLGLSFDVAGEQRGQPPAAETDHDRAVVLGGAAPASCRDSSGDAHRPDPPPIAVAHEMNRNLMFQRRGEKLSCARAAELTWRDPQLAHAEAVDDGGQTPAMVRMYVREHDGIEPLDASIDEHRQ
jgi:hypothetical protein